MSVKSVRSVDDGSSVSETSVLTVRLPSEIINMLDQLVKRRIFSSRSEAIREFCRNYVVRNRTLGGGRHG